MAPEILQARLQHLLDLDPLWESWCAEHEPNEMAFVEHLGRRGLVPDELVEELLDTIEDSTRGTAPYEEVATQFYPSWSEAQTDALLAELDDDPEAEFVDHPDLPTERDGLDPIVAPTPERSAPPRLQTFLTPTDDEEVSDDSTEMCFPDALQATIVPEEEGSNATELYVLAPGSSSSPRGSEEIRPPGAPEELKTIVTPRAPVPQPPEELKTLVTLQVSRAPEPLVTPRDLGGQQTLVIPQDPGELKTLVTPEDPDAPPAHLEHQDPEEPSTLLVPRHDPAADTTLLEYDAPSGAPTSTPQPTSPPPTADPLLVPGQTYASEVSAPARVRASQSHAEIPIPDPPSGAGGSRGLSLWLQAGGLTTLGVALFGLVALLVSAAGAGGALWQRHRSDARMRQLVTTLTLSAAQANRIEGRLMGIQGLLSTTAALTSEALSAQPGARAQRVIPASAFAEDQPKPPGAELQGSDHPLGPGWVSPALPSFALLGVPQAAPGWPEVAGVLGRQLPGPLARQPAAEVLWVRLDAGLHVALPGHHARTDPRSDPLYRNAHAHTQPIWLRRPEGGAAVGRAIEAEGVSIGVVGIELSGPWLTEALLPNKLQDDPDIHGLLLDPQAEPIAWTLDARPGPSVLDPAVISSAQKGGSGYVFGRSAEGVVQLYVYHHLDGPRWTHVIYGPPEVLLTAALR